MLDGKKIIITRKADSNDRIGQPLLAMGAIVDYCELIRTKPREISLSILHDILHGGYNWIVFTSSNGVSSFFEQLQKLFPEALLTAKFAVFGERTAEALESYGYKSDLIGRGGSAISLAEELGSTLAKSDRVLLLLGNLASSALELALAEFCSVKRVINYETTPVQPIGKKALQAIATNTFDLIIITSPSSYESLKSNIPGALQLNAAKVACLGPSTEKILIADGIHPAIVAKPSDNPSLTELIKQQLSNKKTVNAL